MANNKPSFERIAELYGILTAIGLIILFLFMKAIGLARIVELRALNFFIMAAGIIFALRKFRKKSDHFTYLNGLALGLFVAILGSVIFAIFVFIYTSFLDPAFMEYLEATQPFGRYLNPYMVSVAIIIEGIGSGLILAFIVINYMGLLRKDQ